VSGKIPAGKEKLELLKGRYRQYLEVLNRSPLTVKGDLFSLKEFFKYLGEMNIVDVADVSARIIQDYQKHLYYMKNNKDEQNAVSTQNNYLKAVKTFFQFLYEEDYLARNPAKDIRYAKAPKSLPKVILTKNEIKRILKQPNVKTILGYRDRVMLEIFYSTGIRRAELRSLNIDDVDYKSGFLRVNSGKGGKDRVVPMGKIACRYLENYIKGVRPELVKGNKTKALFISKKSGRISKNLAIEMIHKYTKRAGITKRVTCHTFRHSCATHMVRNKAGLRHVQEMLGHSSLNTTQKYIQLTIVDLKEAHKKYHPREREKE